MKMAHAVDIVARFYAASALDDIDEIVAAELLDTLPLEARARVEDRTASLVIAPTEDDVDKAFAFLEDQKKENGEA